MNRLRERILCDEYYPVLLTWALTLACGSLLSATAFTSFAAWEPVSVFWLLVGATAGPLWLFLVRNRRTGRYAILLSLLFVVLLLAFGRKGIQDFLLWIVGTSEDVEFPDARYSVILILAVQWVIGLAASLLLRERAVRRVLFAALIALLLFWDLQGAELDKLGTAISFTLVVVLLAEFLRKFAGRVMVSLAPFFLLVFLLLMSARTSPEPYKWQWIHDTIRAVSEFVKKERLELEYYFGKENDFFVRFAGYSENGGLGGTLLPSRRDYLSVSFQSKPRTAIYVTGRNYDVFTGEGWESSEESQAVPLVEGLYTDEQLNYIQWMRNAYLMDPEYPEDYVKENTGSIRYEDVFTQTIFYPARYKSLSGNPPFDLKNGEGNEYPKPHGVGTTIRFIYLQLNIGSEKMEELLRSDFSDVDDSEALGKISRSFHLMIPENIAEIFAEREARIHEIYGCPDPDCPGIDSENPNLSERTRELLLAVRKAADGDPVTEVELLVDFLSRFTYTTLPDIRLGDEFLDRFLFEGREGYCSHFATAFVLMARELGLPARYVQGFAGDTAKKDLILNANDAHAWAEVYFDGIGWYPIECSPGYSGLISRPWTVEHVQRPHTGGAIYPEEEFPEDIADDVPIEVFVPEEEKESHVGALILVILLAAAVLSVSAVLAVEIRRVKKLPAAGRYRYLIACSLAVLAEEGLRREEDETLRDYRIRIRRSEELRAAAELEKNPELRESTVYRIPERWFEEYEGFRYRRTETTPSEEMLRCAAEVLAALLREYEEAHPKLRTLFLRLSLLFMNTER